MARYLRVLRPSSLRSLRIELSSGFERSRGPARPDCRLLDFAAFAGLRQLVLRGINVQLDHWRRHLGTLLLRSPALRRLHLAVDLSTFSFAAGHGPVHAAVDPFFDALAGDYAAAGGAPLPLRDLDLGVGLKPLSARAVRRLVDLAHLERLAVANAGGPGPEFSYYRAGQGSCGIPFAAMLAESPRLRSFAVTQIHEDVWQALLALGPEVIRRRLRITGGANCCGHSLSHFLQRDLEARRDVLVAIRRAELHLGPDTAEFFLRQLAAGSGASLEHLVVDVDPALPSADGVVEALAAGLGRFPRLTCFRLDWRHWGGRRAQLRAWAEAVARAAPGLRYVRVESRVWRVGRDVGGEGSTTKLRRMRPKHYDEIEYTLRVGGMMLKDT